MVGPMIQLSGVSYLMFYVFIIVLLGYLLGRLRIKGVSLGTSGVFIVALVFGCLFYSPLEAQLAGYTKSALKIIENLGLVLFVTAVGFIAGPGFALNMKKNIKSYVIIGALIICAGGIAAAVCILIGRGLGESNYESFTALMSGLFSGAMTSTPAFSVAKEAVNPAYEDAVAAGHGIAYLFGVIGVVVFVQLVPKIVKVDMDFERTLLTKIPHIVIADKTKGTLQIDSFGIFPVACAIMLGILIGAVKIPITSKGMDGPLFSLTSTGGCLLTSLLVSHFGRVGKINFTPNSSTLKVFRETGLMLFLVGAGISGGAVFLESFHFIYFVYGAIITVLPMIAGYFFATKILKLSFLNSLGAITGGMTSTPALGVLINTAGTDEVASAYAAVYPVALVSLTIVEQLLILIF